MSFLSNLLFPRRCAGCATHGTALCRRCIATIPLALDTDDKRVTGIFDYGHKLVAGAIRNLKYHRRSEQAQELTHAALPHIMDTISELLQSTSQETVILIPIPQHRHKHRERGFNQSLLIAQWINSALPGSVVSPLLSKITFTTPQAHIKNKSLRFKNAAYSMTSNEPLDATSLYIVIDDVTTTGATFIEAIRALKSSGAKKIHCIALAHGYAKK